VPLRFASLAGLCCIAGAMIFGGWQLATRWFFENEIASTTITHLCLVLLSGTQLIGLGILGEYVGRVHRDVMKRPLYLVDRQRGWRSKPPPEKVAPHRCDGRELGTRSYSLPSNQEAA